MTKKKQLPLLLLLVFWMSTFFLLIPDLHVQADDSVDAFTVKAKAAISVDTTSGKILYDQEADTVLPIASITKLLSVYVIEKEIAAGNLSWDDEVPITEAIAQISTDPDLSNVPLIAGAYYTVKELFDAALIQSANAAVMALAEKVAGSESAFVELMKNELTDLGITDAKIVNSSGLNNSYLGEAIYPGSKADDENELSAKDIAIVARHLLQEFPDVLEVTATTKAIFGVASGYPSEMKSWNWMLPGFDYEKAGVDGLKTGTTDLAGACFVGTTTQDGQRIITVVLNATDHETNNGARFEETAKLMDYSYQNWHQETILKANDPYPEMPSATVVEGEALSVPVVLTNDIRLWLRSDMTSDDVTYETTLIQAPWTDGSLQAPFQSGTQIASVSATIAKDTLGYLETSDSPQATTFLQTDKGTEKAGFFELMKRKIVTWFDRLKAKTRL